MKIVILGAAAGGGLPQWNCGCANCTAARRGDIPAQTQASIAVTVDGDAWLLVNASPDLRSQLAHPLLAPRGLRQSPVAAVLLTGAEIDQIAGLLTLRESQPFRLYATAAVGRILRDNSIFDVLGAEVARATTELERPFEPLPGLSATLFRVDGKRPLFLEGVPDEAAAGTDEDDTVGVEFVSAGRRVTYIPGCRSIDDGLRARLAGADALLFDGTVFHDDELVAAGLGRKTGRRMGHVPMAGEGGSLAGLADLDVGRRIYAHVNNTNPVWQPGPERDAIEAAGWELARDGMEIDLA